jgi:phosphate transport system substrate-binding protein
MRVATIAIVLGACGSPPAVDVTLNGSGSTFQKAVQEVAIDGFTRVHPEIAVNYGGGGSGKGRQDFADRVVDYACTDAAFSEADAAKVKGGEFIYVPTALGAIAVAYNLPGVAELSLSAPVLAKIFSRQILRWDDPAIAADNPGVSLPARKIIVVHRADGSGTTENFTRFLKRAGDGAWMLGSASTVQWSKETQAGMGNGGVAQIVQGTEGAIAYLDHSDARASNITCAHVKNRAGRYVEPTLESVTAAGPGITFDDRLIFDALDSDVPDAYPLTAGSWCVAYISPKVAAKGAALKEYLTYVITDAQPLLAEIDYAPIAPAMREQALAQLGRLP